MTSAIRLRLLVAEENAAIRPYDEKQFAAKLHYDRPIASSLAAFHAARLSTGELLDAMTDADFACKGTHPEHGSYGVERCGDLRRARAPSTPIRFAGLGLFK
jgi:hypothetical protein